MKLQIEYTVLKYKEGELRNLTKREMMYFRISELGVRYTKQKLIVNTRTKNEIKASFSLNSVSSQFQGTKIMLKF